jgi:hypothetical protein
VDRSIVSEEKVSANEGASTFRTLERSFFRVCRVEVSWLNCPSVRLSTAAPRNNKNFDLRDRSCRLLCSLRLNARLQNWHLYFFSGVDTVFRGVGFEVEGSEVAAAMSPEAAGMMATKPSYSCRKVCIRSSGHAQAFAQYQRGPKVLLLLMSKVGDALR